MEKKEPQIIPVQYIPVNQCEEDEIDLKELIKTILKYKKFIIIFTFIVTFLAGLYVFLKTPIWEIQSSILIGQINSKPIISPENLREYLSSIYKVELEKKFKKMPNAYLADISVPKKSNFFIILTIDGLSNNYDLQKLKEVLNSIHNGFKDKIEKYKLQKQNEIQNIQFQIQKIKNVTVPNIKTQIKFLQNRIKLQKNLIKYYKNQIKSINQKIVFLNKNINQYKKLIDKLKKANDNNNNISSNLIISNKIISYQNMITDYTNQIKDLSLQKNKIISQTIPDIYDKLKICKIKSII
ncbi:Wzz/FepE/Etk N-terminal domain-containing protein [Lebetimonas sp. JH369]|uniref:Wzz/FepE/Etk N-terminal domain-containing protein n=1 Tax=Lebetimonas sp. JH369 TaxID=990069 RepID=UPI000462F5DF|nr:Wzz/FepE/Etk N-terminal domain-containing protein [Lebetimonas sp. JH369]